MSSEKHHFASKKEWEKYKRDHKGQAYWNEYQFYEEPVSFPCIGVMHVESEGDYGTIHKMEEFVYPSDFR